MISASLPLRAERYHSRDCRPFFAGLLPGLYPELSANMAMRIGRAKNANEVTSKDWLALFQGAGLGPAMAIRRMHKMANDARLRSSQLIKTVPMASGVMQIISRRAAAILALRVGN